MNKHERAIRSVAAVTFRGEDREPIWQLLPAGHSLEINLPTALYPQEQVKALEAERAALLTRYLTEHPLILDIDRRLLILNNQLKMTE